MAIRVRATRLFTLGGSSMVGVKSHESVGLDSWRTEERMGQRLAQNAFGPDWGETLATWLAVLHAISVDIGASQTRHSIPNMAFSFLYP